MIRYRIIKRTYEDDDIRYIVEWRFFWVWLTCVDSCCGVSDACEFTTIEEAKECMAERRGVRCVSEDVVS